MYIRQYRDKIPARMAAIRQELSGAAAAGRPQPLMVAVAGLPANAARLMGLVNILLDLPPGTVRMFADLPSESEFQGFEPAETGVRSALELLADSQPGSDWTPVEQLKQRHIRRLAQQALGRLDATGTTVPTGG